MQHPGPRRPPNPQRAPGWAVLGAVLGLLLAGLVAIPGCLNPRPEEDPSALELADPDGSSDVSSDDDAPVAQRPERETCDDNALLDGCPLPATPGANAATPPPPSEADPAVPADAGAPSVGDAGGVDAGAAGAAAAGSPLAE